MTLQILPFAEDHLAEAAQLLAERHRRHRTASPLLSARFEDPAVCEAEVAEVWKTDGASGAVAAREGRMVGYLLGAPKDSRPWGPNVWVESAGQALRADEDAETIRDLYGVAAARWVDADRTAHYVVTPAHDAALVQAWFRGGFGHQHTHALTANRATAPGPHPGITIRPAEREDIPTLARLDCELDRHQSLSPVFGGAEPGTVEAALKEWEEDWGDPDFPTWVAVHEDRVVGHAVGCALTKSSGNAGLIRPDHAGFLGFAAVLPEARGLGAGRALGETVMQWSGQAGFDCVATDWRQTNLLSSRTWPRLGFEPTFLRLHRLVGY